MGAIRFCFLWAKTAFKSTALACKLLSSAYAFFSFNCFANLSKLLLGCFVSFFFLILNHLLRLLGLWSSTGIISLLYPSVPLSMKVCSAYLISELSKFFPRFIELGGYKCPLSSVYRYCDRASMVSLIFSLGNPSNSNDDSTEFFIMPRADAAFGLCVRSFKNLQCIFVYRVHSNY